MYVPTLLPSRPAVPASGAENSATPEDACRVIQSEHIVLRVSDFAGFAAARSTIPTQPSPAGLTRHARSGAFGSRQPRKSRRAKSTVASGPARVIRDRSPRVQLTNEARTSASVTGFMGPTVTAATLGPPAIIERPGHF